MNKNQKLRITYYLNKQRSVNGLLPLYVRIIIDGARAEIATTHLIKTGDWDSNLMRLKTGAPNEQFLNGFLDDLKSRLNKLFLVALATNEMITAKQLKALYLGKSIDEAPTYKTICQAFDYHNLKMGEQVKVGMITPKTHLRYKITKDKVVNFMKKVYKVEDKPLPELRLAFVTDFEHYLRTKEKLENNTAHKYITNLKKIMNMSVGLDWIPSNPFNQFKCTYTNPEREILTQEELDKIKNKDISIARLSEVRDVFVFCCYTGFAYSEIFKFERNAMTIGIDGEYWLSTHREKTGTRESVPLLPVALEIIRKYQNHEYCTKYNKLMPVNSNQRYNAYLKEIADICGIKKRITTHIARHTFATTVTLSNGVPMETVSRMLGHTKLATTQIYAKVLDHKVSEDMKMLRAKLERPVNEERKNVG